MDENRLTPVVLAAFGRDATLIEPDTTEISIRVVEDRDVQVADSNGIVARHHHVITGALDDLVPIAGRKIRLSNGKTYQLHQQLENDGAMVTVTLR